MLECKEDKPELALQSQGPDNSDVLRLIHVPLESPRGDRCGRQLLLSHLLRKLVSPSSTRLASTLEEQNQKNRKEKGRPCPLPASSPYSPEAVCLPVLCAMDTFGGPVKSVNASQKKSLFKNTDSEINTEYFLKKWL